MYQKISHLHIGHISHRLFVLMLTIVFLSTATGVSAQNPEWVVFNTDNSELPGNTVYDLAIDPQGVLWICTYGGLARFDGVSWTVYTTDNSGLPDDKVTALTFDAHETLWVGTRGGLAHFDGSNWTVYTTDNSGLPYNAVHELAFDAQGTLWIGTGEFWDSGSGGVAKFDGASWTVYNTENSNLPSNHIIGLAIDSQGNIWAGTTVAGAAKFDGETWTVYNRNNSELPNHDVPAFAFDAQGNTWMVTCGGGMTQFDGETWTVYNRKNSGLPSDSTIELVIDTQKNFWIGTTLNGVTKFDGKRWTVYDRENSGLPDRWIWTIVTDTQGNIWLGTDAGGLAVYREGGVILPEQGIADTASLQQSKQDTIPPGQLDEHYLLYLPEEYEKSQNTWPLLLFLHGTGERGTNLELLKKHGLPKLIEQGQDFPFVVLSPQCSENQASWSVDFLDRVLNDVIEKYRIDENRLYVTGLSIGGTGTWTLALAYPERFAAIAPICGWSTPEQAELLKDLPVWAFHGAKDNRVPLELGQGMVDALEKAGGKVKFTIYPDGDHDVWTETYNNPELYEWLLQHQKAR